MQLVDGNLVIKETNDKATNKDKADREPKGEQ